MTIISNPLFIKSKLVKLSSSLSKNKGQFVHEFNIGTEPQHLKHQPEMAEMTMMGILYPEYIDKDKNDGNGKDEPFDEPFSR